MKKVAIVLAVCSTMSCYALAQSSNTGQHSNANSGYHHSTAGNMNNSTVTHKNTAHKNWNKGYNKKNRNGEHTIRKSNNYNP